MIKLQLEEFRSLATSFAWSLSIGVSALDCGDHLQFGQLSADWRFSEGLSSEAETLSTRAGVYLLG